MEGANGGCWRVQGTTEDLRGTWEGTGQGTWGVAPQGACATRGALTEPRWGLFALSMFSAQENSQRSRSLLPSPADGVLRLRQNPHAPSYL